MEIQSAKYHPLGGISAVINGIEMLVPNDPGNRHMQAIVAWAEIEGNEIEEHIVSLDDVKDEARAAMHEKHAAIMRDLTGNATVEERDTWQAKSIAAQAIKDGNATDIQTEMIATEAQIVGEDIDTLVKLILAKSNAFHQMIGFASGLRRKTEAAIDAAKDTDEVGAVLTAADAEAQEFKQQWLKESGLNR